MSALPERWVAVCQEEDIPEGTSRAWEVGSQFIVICRSGGELHALEDICPHDLGPLGDGEIEDGELVCPRHGARFDVRTGEVLCLPATSGLRRFPVRREDGRVLVRLDGEGTG